MTRDIFPKQGTLATNAEAIPVTSQGMDNSVWTQPSWVCVPQGWQCPVCKKVHAPWIPECECYKSVARYRKMLYEMTSLTDWQQAGYDPAEYDALVEEFEGK